MIRLGCYGQPSSAQHSGDLGTDLARPTARAVPVPNEAGRVRVQITV